MDDSILSSLHRYVMDGGCCSICGQAEGYLTVASNGSLVHKQCAAAVPGATYNLVNSYVCETKPVAAACMKERPSLEEGTPELLPHNEAPSALTRTHIEFMLPTPLPPLSSGCTCSICRHRKGRLVSCSYPGCTRTFHVSCARPNMCICMPSANGLFVRCLDHIPTSFRYDSVVNAVIPLVYLSADTAVQDKIQLLRQSRDAWGRLCTRMKHLVKETNQRLQNYKHEIVRYYGRKIHYCTLRNERVLRCERSMLEPWTMKDQGTQICAEIKRSFTSEVLRWNSLRVLQADATSGVVDTSEPFNNTVYVTPMYRPPGVVEEPLFSTPPYRPSTYRPQRKAAISMKRALRSSDRMESEKEKVRVVEGAAPGVSVAVAVEMSRAEPTGEIVRGDVEVASGDMASGDVEIAVSKEVGNGTIKEAENGTPNGAEKALPKEPAKATEELKELTQKKARVERKERATHRTAKASGKKADLETELRKETQKDSKEAAAPKKKKKAREYELSTEWEDWSSSPSVVSSAFEPDESDSEEKKESQEKPSGKAKEERREKIVKEPQQLKRERDKKERERRKEKREIQRALQQVRTEREREQRLEVKKKQREEREKERKREEEERKRREEERKREEEEEKKRQEEERKKKREEERKKRKKQEEERKRKREEERRKKREEEKKKAASPNTPALSHSQPSPSAKSAKPKESPHSENTRSASRGNMETRRSKGAIGAMVVSSPPTHA